MYKWKRKVKIGREKKNYLHEKRSKVLAQWIQIDRMCVWNVLWWACVCAHMVTVYHHKYTQIIFTNNLTLLYDDSLSHLPIDHTVLPLLFVHNNFFLKRKWKIHFQSLIQVNKSNAYGYKNEKKIGTQIVLNMLKHWFQIWRLIVYLNPKCYRVCFCVCVCMCECVCVFLLP